MLPIKQFLIDKIKIYVDIEKISENDALNRVFYELPTTLCESFLKKSKINKSDLLTFLTHKDLVVNANFNNLLNEMSNLNANKIASPISLATTSFASPQISSDFSNSHAFLNLSEKKKIKIH